MNFSRLLQRKKGRACALPFWLTVAGEGLLQLNAAATTRPAEPG